MNGMVYDDTQCHLGEGPLWHPETNQLFWFDILRRRLLTRTGGQTRHWQFDEQVSAAGWIDSTSLLIASETRLFRFDLTTGLSEGICELEHDDPETRSNDGRADPWGGFWIGTMGKSAKPGAGAIYRYYRGEPRRLFAPITIPNAICFSPDRRFAYFADTAKQQIMRQPLTDRDGWPRGDAELWLDLRSENLNPDGAVTDAAGNVWNAQWGAARVACYAPDGRFLRAVGMPASHTSCPALGGPGLETLYCTSARSGLSADALAATPAHGMTFCAEQAEPGVAEYRVIL